MMSSYPWFRRHLFCLGLLTALCIATATAADMPKAAPEMWHYSIKPGDTLIGVANAFLKNPNDWPKLQTINLIPDPKRLVPGSTLRLPVALLRREAAVAEVVFVQGQATRMAQDGSKQPLAEGAKLQIGDIIETPADASVSLRFVDGSRLLLTPNSKLVLNDMQLLGKAGIAQTILELQRGSLDTGVAKQDKPGARYEIKSRSLNLAVRGTEFRVAVDEANQATRSEVIEGVVQASGEQGKAVAVQAGFGTQATAGQAAAAPRALLPAPVLSQLPARFERIPLRIGLPPTAGATRYRAQVFADNTFRQLLLDGTFTDGSAKWADLPDGRYMLRVRAIDSAGLEGLNADREFVLKARPEPPFLNAPLDGTKSYGTETTLRWSASTKAQRYHVQVSAQADFNTLLSEAGDLTKTEHVVALAPGQYYWRVASIAPGADHGPFSDVQAFTQRPIPESPQMGAPEISEQGMLFRWSAGASGSQYQVQLARDADFNDLVLDKQLTSNEVRIEPLPAGTYYLRSKTIDADGFAGPFGTAQKLEVPGTQWKWLLFLIPLIPLAL
ncbi:FecR domain-containing protein [Uliginosibacterium sp. H3]|uniref:FecR domain-containing protein n=1 Tax=Uliginosibacterium silvisoli TaxID=3114758 RepID=A0ABU6K346_9RHOO|nr:FecR domain-containing protein [Uliginosibacterium sp. H3]